MIDSSLVDKLRERYNHIHPLAFHRSVERAETAGELFDMLDGFPNTYPVVWDEVSRRWVIADDLSLADRFDVESVRRKK